MKPYTKNTTRTWTERNPLFTTTYRTNWDLSNISHIVSNQTLDEILQIHIPRYSNIPDRLHGLVPTMVTSLLRLRKSSLIARITISLDGCGFGNWKIPQNSKLVRHLLHDRLPTNPMRAIRGIATSSACPCCNSSPEDITHLLQGCVKANALWPITPKTVWGGALLNAQPEIGFYQS